MPKHFLIAAALVCTQTLTHAQGNTQTNTPAPRPVPMQRTNALDLSEYGVQFAPDQRLVVVMAALDAAGFEPTPGKDPSYFRAQVRKDQATLDPDLRQRMQRFYTLNKLPGTRTVAEQAARYVSLAFALGPLPTLESPARSDDLPAGVLDVLDFAPLVREFYRKSGIEARLPEYLKLYQAAGDQMRRPLSETVRGALAFLHTRPVTSVLEQVAITNPSAEQKKKGIKFTTRERERRFRIVPDLLAAPGAFNLRVVGDDYFLVVPFNADARSADVRRAYLQFLIDPLVLRFNRQVAARRADLHTLLDGVSGPPVAQARADAGAGEQVEGQTAPRRYDVFTAVARSLVAATDAQMWASARQQALTEDAAARLAKASTTEREKITQDLQTARAAVEDEKAAQLAEAYERGAVLAFYFAEQLREQDVAGFDISDLLPDMLARFDATREKGRLTEVAAARARAAEARKRAQAATITSEDDPALARRAQLVKTLDETNELLRLKKYEEAETRLKALMQEYQGEPRVFFALAQVASSAAQDTFDEDLRADRLGRALANYRFAVEHASLDIETDRALASRAHVAMGRILKFLDRNDEALKEFDAAIQLGDVPNGAYRDAQIEKNKLQQPPPQ